MKANMCQIMCVENVTAQHHRLFIWLAACRGSSSTSALGQQGSLVREVGRGHRKILSVVAQICSFDRKSAFSHKISYQSSIYTQQKFRLGDGGSRKPDL